MPKYFSLSVYSSTLIEKSSWNILPFNPYCNKIKVQRYKMYFVVSHFLLNSKWTTSTLSLEIHDFDGLAQDCSNSIANALELLQSWTKPSIYVSVNCVNIYWDHGWMPWSK